MNRADLVSKTAEALGCTKASVDEVLKTMEVVIYDTIGAGENVKIMTGLELIVKDVESAKRRNPYTGEAITVPAHKKVCAKIGNVLKKAAK